MMRKITILCLLFFLFIGKIYAQQDLVQPVSEAIIQDYLSKAKEYSVIYSGKLQYPYDPNIVNHPYLTTSEYSEGSLSYNNIVYTKVLMRLDLYKDELIVLTPDKLYNVFLENEKFEYARFNDYLVIPSVQNRWKDAPSGKYILLLHDGKYSVIKKYLLDLQTRVQSTHVEREFTIKERYYICKDGRCYSVKSKGSVLKLFPDKKRELNSYAKMHKLNFGKNTESAIVEMVKHYETLSK